MSVYLVGFRSESLFFAQIISASNGQTDRVRKVAHFPIFLNLELLFCEIFDCKE